MRRLVVEWLRQLGVEEHLRVHHIGHQEVLVMGRDGHPGEDSQGERLGVDKKVVPGPVKMTLG